MGFFSFFSGDIIMTGEGHKDWLSDCDFHPGYAPYSKSLSVAAAFVRVRVVIRSENSALFLVETPSITVLWKLGCRIRVLLLRLRLRFLIFTVKRPYDSTYYSVHSERKPALKKTNCLLKL